MSMVTTNVIPRAADCSRLERVYAGKLEVTESERLVVQDELRDEIDVDARPRLCVSVETVVSLWFEGVLVCC